MPSSHRAYADWTPSRLVSWAEKTGLGTARVVSEIMASRPHPEQGFRSCMGVMRLGERHGAARLEAACLRAERLGSYRYKTIKNILSAGLDQLALEEEVSSGKAPAMHDNIRGSEYYK